MDQQQKEPLPEGPAVPYPSGVWVGYWQVGGRQWPMSVLLEFFPTAFTGTGEDSCGLFRVIGTYGRSPTRLTGLSPTARTMSNTAGSTTRSRDA